MSDRIRCVPGNLYARTLSDAFYGSGKSLAFNPVHIYWYFNFIVIFIFHSPTNNLSLIKSSDTKLFLKQQTILQFKNVTKISSAANSIKKSRVSRMLPTYNSVSSPKCLKIPAGKDSKKLWDKSLGKETWLKIIMI